MRVIAGEAKGRKLKSGRGDKARPTGDRVKEALFNMLFDFVVDASFLDLFAGFGGVGIEAISRGAKKVIFVEQDIKHVKIIKENLQLTKFEDRAQVITGDVLKVLPRLEGKFDLIFMDPPYAETELYEKSLLIIIEHNLLNEDGIVVCEHRQALSPRVFDFFQIIKTKSYGESNLTFLEMKKNREET